MMSEVSEWSCPFCRLAKLQESTAIQALFPDRLKPGEIVHEDVDLYVVVDAAPLVAGHCLIVLKEHKLSIASVWRDIRNQIYSAKSFIKEKLSSAPNCKPIYFEHGTRDSYEHSCIEHAHIHAFPSEVPVVECFRRHGVKMERLSGGYNDLRSTKWERQYFMLSDYGGKSYFVSGYSLPSQIIRQILAEQQRLSVWNWQDYIQMPIKLNTRMRVQDTLHKFSISK
jgi:diadenosine tetraphosphate (Ap4A) HIT family hydrolase